MSIQVSPQNMSTINHSPVEKRRASLNQWLERRSKTNLDWLNAIRDRTLPLIQEQELPSTKDEDWRFTDLSALYEIDFTPQIVTLTKEAIAPFNWDGISHQAVFINGQFSPTLSSIDDLPEGITFQSIETLDTTNQQRISQHPGAGEIFTAINTASFTDVAALHVEKNKAITTPIHLLFIAVTDEVRPTLSVPRLLITLESGAIVTVIEDYVSIGNASTYTNTVAEISLDTNAQLHHTRIQRESKQAFHIGKSAISQARDSHYCAVSLSLGGRIARHTPEITIIGECTNTILDGLTLATDEQLIDTHSTITFTAPHCTAQQLHKCIIDDHARAVFNGKVFVPKVAQQTNAGQLSRNLLLSPKARVDTKPQLEIIADDVKCAHGATVSQLEEDEVFYLQSRGLDRESACDLLVEAFATEILEKSAVASIRQKLLKQILDQVR